MTEISAPVVFVGVDVSKDTLDVCLLTPALEPQQQQQHSFSFFSLDNSAKGVLSLLEKLKPFHVQRLVVESTGGYERLMAYELLSAQMPVAVVNPARTRAFAQSMGTLAKTDKIDSKVLARFAQVIQPRISEKPTEKQLQLDALLCRRRQLVAMKTMETNRLPQTLDKSMARQIDKHITQLEKHIKDTEVQIQTFIDNDQDFKEQIELLDSVPGVAKTSAVMMLVTLPELGKLNRAEIAALAGVAPMNHDSGHHRGKRRVRGGRADSRATLYMVAWVATRKNAKIKAYYDRLRAAGKPFKVAVMACMRKLLTIFNVMLKTRTAWNENLVLGA